MDNVANMLNAEISRSSYKQKHVTGDLNYTDTFSLVEHLLYQHPFT